MSEFNKGELDTLIQQKLEADTEFQNSLADLSDEDKDKAIANKKSELIEQELIISKNEGSKNKELADNYKIRAEKAEKALPPKKDGEEKKAGEGESPKKNTSGEDDKDLSSKDLLAIINAKVHADDVDEVVEYAKFKKISVEEALKSDVIKTTLSQKDEQRKIAEGTNTRDGNGGRKGNYKVSDDALLKKGETGELPESDDDLKRLAKLNIEKSRR